MDSGSTVGKNVHSFQIAKHARTTIPLNLSLSSQSPKAEMALVLTSHPSFLFGRPRTLRLYSLRSSNPSLSFTNPRFPSFRAHSSFSGDSGDFYFPGRFSINRPPSKADSDEKFVVESSGEFVDEEKSDGVSAGITDEWGEKGEPEVENSYTKLSDADPPKDENEWEESGGAVVSDEWGEKGEPEAETYTKLSDADPPKNEDEWGGGEDSMPDSGSTDAYDKLGELKRCLVDTVYETDFGFRASSEIRSEVLELVNQLESSNPTLAPVEAPAILDGNWVLLYTAFSELLPLLATGTTPLLKVKNICQLIDSKSLTIENSTTLSSPFATFSFSASATFEVRSPSRIQVRFKEGIFQPPEIKSSLDLPGDVEVFGQKINLSPVQQSLNPFQEFVASISRTISGQPPVKVPIPGDRSSSWLLITYLDEDLRISRGDGGLFVLAKEGSPLLDRWS